MKKRKFYPGQTEEPYVGKVREVSTVDDIMVAVCTNDISAFDVRLPFKVPYKGTILNLLSADGMEKTADIVPNCLLAVPHPRVSLWRKTTPFKVEMVIRGYLVGHAWREYEAGKRTLCGVPLPDGMKENEKFPTPIITPTTKASEGHDEDISREEIISSGLVSKADYEVIERYTYALFQRGTEIALNNGLILVDTKYEFGKDDKEGIILLIDEVHTPDSSRYFYASTYKHNLAHNLKQKQLSKEFVRERLIDCGFMGRPGDILPIFTPDFIESISERYKELYLKMGLPREDLPGNDNDDDLYEKVCKALENFN